MQFVLIGYDAKDAKALDRRMAARPAHVEMAKKLKSEGRVVHAGAMLGDDTQMIGSVVVYNVENRAELDLILQKEPYLLGGVWEKTIIKPFKVADL